MKKILLTAFAAAMLVGCGSVKIRQVLNNPSRYQGRDIRLSGEVTRATGVVVAGVYEINDGTGKINVLSARPIPNKGAHVTVTGRMQGGVNILGTTLGSVFQEKSVRVHR